MWLHWIVLHQSGDYDNQNLNLLRLHLLHWPAWLYINDS